MLKFSKSQMANIEAGKSKRNSLLRAAKKSVNLVGDELHPHTYLFSNPGLGKTYNVTKSIKESGKTYKVISGSISMFAFGLDLMVAHFEKREGEKIFIIVDDCDQIIDTVDNLNIMKNVLSGNKIFQRKQLTPTHMLTEYQRTILPEYQKDGELGYEVPCDDFVFIFCSNYKLPTDAEVKASIDKKGASKSSNRLMSLNAIRSRCVTKDFTMDWEIEWGWISEVILNDYPDFKVGQESKIIILDWMYNNWNNMTEHSVRTAEKMAQVMVDEGDDYRDAWESDFLI
jgi:hypothetical protein